MNSTATASPTWTVLGHLDYGGESAVCMIEGNDDGFRALPLPVDHAEPEGHAPYFLGWTPDRRLIVMDPVSRAISLREAYPARAHAPYGYPEREAGRLWFTIDGDKETGNDPLHCDGGGAPILVLDTRPAALLQLSCMGRGHHVVAFTAPTPKHPHVPRRAFVSSLFDGYLSVLGNDPMDAATFLQVLATIDLCEPEREPEGVHGVPNHAFPHGMVFSPHTGKLYSLNNGYGTIAVIDPATLEIEGHIVLPVSSNLLLSPDGRYLIGKGADRKSDPEHVIGQLSVVDVEKGEVVNTLELPDFYPSTYRFAPDGSRLYVTSAATGKGVQREHLQRELIQVYEAGVLPELRLLREVRVGLADCGRRPIAFVEDPGRGTLTLVPNPSAGTLSILAGPQDEVLETVTLSGRPIREFNFSFWDGKITGS